VVLGLLDHESYVYAEAATDAWRIGRVVDGVDAVLASSGSGTPGPGQATTVLVEVVLDGQVVRTVPDYIDDVGRRVGEIKDVRDLSSYGTQIKAQIKYARDPERLYEYYLHVRPDTIIPNWLEEMAGGEKWLHILRDVESSF
jgi:hypothetical protein